MPGFIAMRREGHAGASKSCPSSSAGDARDAKNDSYSPKRGSWMYNR